MYALQYAEPLQMIKHIEEVLRSLRSVPALNNLKSSSRTVLGWIDWSRYRCSKAFKLFGILIIEITVYKGIVIDFF